MPISVTRRNELINDIALLSYEIVQQTALFDNLEGSISSTYNLKLVQSVGQKLDQYGHLILGLQAELIDPAQDQLSGIIAAVEAIKNSTVLQGLEDDQRDLCVLIYKNTISQSAQAFSILIDQNVLPYGLSQATLNQTVPKLNWVQQHLERKSPHVLDDKLTQARKMVHSQKKWLSFIAFFRWICRRDCTAINKEIAVLNSLDKTLQQQQSEHDATAASVHSVLGEWELQTLHGHQESARDILAQGDKKSKEIVDQFLRRSDKKPKTEEPEVDPAVFNSLEPRDDLPHPPHR